MRRPERAAAAFDRFRSSPSRTTWLDAAPDVVRLSTLTAARRPKTATRPDQRGSRLGPEVEQDRGHAAVLEAAGEQELALNGRRPPAREQGPRPDEEVGHARVLGELEVFEDAVERLPCLQDCRPRIARLHALRRLPDNFRHDHVSRQHEGGGETQVRSALQPGPWREQFDVVEGAEEDLVSRLSSSPQSTSASASGS